MDCISRKRLQLPQPLKVIKMKLNQKQKKIFYIWLLIVTAAISTWVGFGGEVFTKTQIIVEKRDELLGTTFKEWEEKFVLGLDYTIGFIGIVSMITAFIVWWLKTK